MSHARLLVVTTLCLLGIRVHALLPHPQTLLDAGGSLSQSAAIVVPAEVKTEVMVLVSATIAAPGSQTKIYSLWIDTGSSGLVLNPSSQPIKGYVAKSYLPCNCAATAKCNAALQDFAFAACRCDDVSNPCYFDGLGELGGVYENGYVLNSTVTIGGVANYLPTFLQNDPFSWQVDGYLGIAPAGNFGNYMFSNGGNSIGFCLDSNLKGHVMFGNPGACSSAIRYVPLIQQKNTIQGGFFIANAEVCTAELKICLPIPPSTFYAPRFTTNPAKDRPQNGWVAWCDTGNSGFGVPASSWDVAIKALQAICNYNTVCAQNNPFYGFPFSTPEWGCVPNITDNQFANWPVFRFTLQDSQHPNNPFQVVTRGYAHRNPGTCTGALDVRSWLIFSARDATDPTESDTWSINIATLTEYYALFDSVGGRAGFLQKANPDDQLCGCTI